MSTTIFNRRHRSTFQTLNMIKLFFEYLKDAVRDHMRVAAPEFVERKSPIKGLYGSSLVYSWRVSKQLSCYIAFSSIRDRDWVELLAAWSTQHKFPAQLNNLGDIEELWRFLAKHDDDLEALFDGRSEVLLSPGQFGHVGGWNMPHFYAPIERVAKVYDHPNAKRVLADMGFTDWRAEPVRIKSLSTWGMLEFNSEDFGLGGLDRADAEYAVGELIPEICDFIDQKYLPYLRNFATRLGTDAS